MVVYPHSSSGRRDDNRQYTPSCRAEHVVPMPWPTGVLVKMTTVIPVPVKVERIDDDLEMRRGQPARPGR